ncbi:cystathionine gamma-lyase cys3 [Stygiomarasmius scandens]|uniref:cystathionine gamma-lyase n=1 Tax=Marasmiellus scandens TaxID=2682957 RepID=A0ABR1JW40_9AGAR
MTIIQDLPTAVHSFKPAHEVNGTNGHTPKKQDGFGTRAIHVGSEANPETGAVIPPISLSTTYKQDGVGNHKGFEYSRSGNPNRNALEQTLASIEAGGAEAIAFASGSSTTANIIQSLGPNAHIISVNDVYGGTFRYMTRVAPATQGLQTTFLDLQDLSESSSATKALLSSIRPDTKLVWVETPTNPTLRMIDIARLSAILSSHSEQTGLPRPLILVDNTFASPFYTSPLLLGADVVLHSLTKYVNGHSDVVMGALILPARHTIPTPQFPEEGGLVAKLRFLQNANGAVPSPYDSWLAQRGAKTLHLRMKQHGLNALKVAKFLETSPHVEEVIYPGFATSSGNEEKDAQAKKRRDIAWSNLSLHATKWINSLPDSEANEEAFPYSGMVSFRLRLPPSVSTGSHEADEAKLATLTSDFLSALRLFTLAESLGGVESLAEVPARMTHASIPPKEREELGISEGLVRLSVGVEEAEDLVRDLESGLAGVFGRL